MNTLLRWIPALIMMGIIFTLSSTPGSLVPYFGEVDVLIKKGGHAVGYAVLALSYYFALPRRLSKGYRFVMAWLMALLFALSDEYHQSFVEGRNSTIRDVMIDGAGAGIALLLGLIYSSNSNSNSTP